MAQVTRIQRDPSETIQKILAELQMLRNKVSLLLPQDELKNYAHANRIRNSYKKAIKKYPQALAWK